MVAVVGRLGGSVGWFLAIDLSGVDLLIRVLGYSGMLVVDDDDGKDGLPVMMGWRRRRRRRRRKRLVITRSKTKQETKIHHQFKANDCSQRGLR
jgi:hypothetical protein